jgi:tetrahydromethanopterin S-methyltransferase subunit D
VTGTINSNGNYAAGLTYMYTYVYTGVLGNFRRVGEVGVFSCSDSVKMKQITHVSKRKLHLARTDGHIKYNGQMEKVT